MKPNLLIIFSLLVCFACGEKHDNQINIAITDSFHSNILNENRELLIHIPSNYNPRYAKDSYPVVYVLDPEAHFLSVVSMIDRMSTNQGNEACPQMIVVGIKNTNRLRDFFPNQSEDLFQTFLEKELIPYIDEKYPTRPYKTLIGHSIAGLRTVHTAMAKPDLFNAYLAIDPSLCHEYCSWFEEYKDDIPTFSLNNNKMFIGMGNTMLPERDTSVILTDTSGIASHMQSIMHFSKKMISKNDSLMPDFGWKYYPSENHGSVTLPATYDGINFLFQWYRNESLGKFFDPKISADSAMTELESHYEKVSNILGYREIPLENEIAPLAEYLFNRKFNEKAVKLAEFNLKNYPNSQQAKEHLAKFQKNQSNQNHQD